MSSVARLHVGTSGFSYDEWRPAFYPEHVKKKDMLAFYASRLAAVELNNTFYRMPSATNVAAWAAAVPEGFRFAIKATRRMTWSQKLVDCGELLDYLFAQLEPLGDKLGCVFYQVPKFVRADVDVLRRFLADHPRPAPVAFEFAHDSWSSPDVHALLREHDATVVASDRDDADEPALPDGAPWLYLRLRRAAYGDAELRAWRDRIDATGARDAFVFFKHEDSCAGPALARRFLDV